MTAATAFTHADALFEFGFTSDAQRIVNESAIDMELSWDGQNVQAIIPATSREEYTFHGRSKAFVRRTGAGGGPHNVQVVAWTR
jgi:hypothetical protein